MTQCGAATIMSQKGFEFPKIELLESVKKWQRSFFYVKNLTLEDRINLPPFMNTPSMKMKNWTYNPMNKITSINVVHTILGN
jgi:hypothetical protein